MDREFIKKLPLDIINPDNKPILVEEGKGGTSISFGYSKNGNITNIDFMIKL